MEEEPCVTRSQYRIIVTFRNTRKHARDGVEIRTTHGVSPTKKTNHSVEFVRSSVLRSAIAPFRFLTHNSRQLRFRTLAGTLHHRRSDSTAQGKLHYEKIL